MKKLETIWVSINLMLILNALAVLIIYLISRRIINWTQVSFQILAVLDLILLGIMWNKNL